MTIGAQAYRFGPHGMKFDKPVSLTVPYDRFRFPSGMSEEDLGVFFFDEAVGKYHQVQTIKGSASAHTLTAASTHFTDFIAATIATPDHPAADSFNPNLIKDVKSADPAAGVDLDCCAEAQSRWAGAPLLPNLGAPGPHGDEAGSRRSPTAAAVGTA